MILLKLKLTFEINRLYRRQVSKKNYLDSNSKSRNIFRISLVFRKTIDT